MICPGGGYGSLGAETEGTDIVKWLNAQGITGIVLKYRVPKRHQGFPQHHHALQDIQRAMGLIRQQAHEWNLDPRRTFWPVVPGPTGFAIAKWTTVPDQFGMFPANALAFCEVGSIV